MAITLQPGNVTDGTDGTDDDFYPSSDGKPMAESDLHLELMVYNRDALKGYYRERPDVYVAGNNFLYYQPGNRKAVVSPDCYVVFGVEKRLRDTYKVWEEGGNQPSVVFEITSKTTRRQDVRIKRPLYEQVLRVPEYFQFDPTGDYLKPRLQGLRLIAGRYEAVPLIEGRMHSEVLGLDLVVEGNWMRFYDPARGLYLLTHEEETRRADTAVAVAQRVEAMAQRMEEQGRYIKEQVRHAETEIVSLRAEAEITRMRTEVEIARLRAEAEATQAENARLRAELDALRKQE